MVGFLWRADLNKRNQKIRHNGKRSGDMLDGDGKVVCGCALVLWFDRFKFHFLRLP